VGDGSRTPEEDNLSFAIETLGDPPVLAGRSWLSTAGARPRDRWAMTGIALAVRHDGRWYDTVLMSILDHEWAARRSPGR
jgi:RimJ/RimL family protein N-acetyltransferase